MACNIFPDRIYLYRKRVKADTSGKEKFAFYITSGSFSLAGAVLIMILNSMNILIGASESAQELAEALSALSIVLLFVSVAFFVTAKLSRDSYKIYYSLKDEISPSEKTSIESLALKLGISNEQVCKNIDSMIDKGYFNGYYRDCKNNVVVPKSLPVMDVLPMHRKWKRDTIAIYAAVFFALGVVLCIVELVLAIQNGENVAPFAIGVVMYALLSVVSFRYAKKATIKRSRINCIYTMAEQHRISSIDEIASAVGMSFDETAAALNDMILMRYLEGIWFGKGNKTLVFREDLYQNSDISQNDDDNNTDET